MIDGATGPAFPFHWSCCWRPTWRQVYSLIRPLNRKWDESRRVWAGYGNSILLNVVMFRHHRRHEGHVDHRANRAWKIGNGTRPAQWMVDRPVSISAKYFHTSIKRDWGFIFLLKGRFQFTRCVAGRPSIHCLALLSVPRREWGRIVDVALEWQRQRQDFNKHNNLSE